MCLRGGNALWGNTARSHDVCTAETSKYSRDKLNNVDTCKAINLIIEASGMIVILRCNFYGELLLLLLCRMYGGMEL